MQEPRYFDCRCSRDFYCGCGDIDDAADLRLGMMQLVVKATQRSFGRTRVVVLDESIADAQVGELRLMVGFDEEAAGVAINYWTQLKDARKGCLDSFH